MKADHLVQVLDEGRLRSELSMFIWVQAERSRDNRSQRGEGPGHDAGFLQSKDALAHEVLKLAGRKLSLLELIGRLTDIIGQGKNEEIHFLDPQNMASKISTRVTP